MAELVVVVVERPVRHLRCLGVRPLTAQAGSWELGGVEDEQMWEELVWLLVPSVTSRDPPHHHLDGKGVTSQELGADGRERLLPLYPCGERSHHSWILLQNFFFFFLMPKTLRCRLKRLKIFF